MLHHLWRNVPGLCRRCYSTRQTVLPQPLWQFTWYEDSLLGWAEPASGNVSSADGFSIAMDETPDFSHVLLGAIMLWDSHDTASDFALN